MRTDVVVVGAGLAGAATADQLARQGLGVTVLEARGRTGGRLWTRLGPAGLLVDVGGQWIGPGQDRVLSLVDELELRTIPQHAAGASVLSLGGRVRRCRGRIPTLSPHRLVDLQAMMWRLDRSAARIDPARPWASDHAGDLDATTVGAWLRAHARTSAAASLVRLAVHAVFAVEPDQLSMLVFLAYVRAAGGLMALLDVEGGAQERRIVGGAQQLVTRLVGRAEDHGADVRFDCPARHIAWGPDGVTVTADGAIRARRAVITVPPALVDRIAFGPALPGRRSRLQARMPMGSVVKCHLAYDRPWWRDDGLSGECVTDEGPVRMAFDATPEPEGAGLLVAFVLADEAARFSGLATDEQRSAILDQLGGLLGPRATQVRDVTVQDWCAEPFSGGCYVGLAAPGTLSRLGPALRAPVGPLHWAGTETATAWTGYMEGALESADRVAAEVLAAG